MPRALVVKVTAGADDPERCGQVISVAATAAVVAGGRVTVCSQCAVRRGIGEADLLEGVRALVY